MPDFGDWKKNEQSELRALSDALADVADRLAAGKKEGGHA